MYTNYVKATLKRQAGNENANINNFDIKTIFKYYDDFNTKGNIIKSKSGNQKPSILQF